MKKTTLITGGLVLILLLAGAAFIGARLLNGQGLLNVPSMFPGAGGRHTVYVGDILPAKELPQGPADVHGLFDHRRDNSIFVGTGQLSVGVERDANGNVKTSSSHSGPVVEVVITNQTTIYRDVTEKQYSGDLPSGQKIQQVVEPGSADEIGQYSVITIWGRKTGDRFIADVLVYKPPTFITK